VKLFCSLFLKEKGRKKKSVNQLHLHRRCKLLPPGEAALVSLEQAAAPSAQYCGRKLPSRLACRLPSWVPDERFSECGQRGALDGRRLRNWVILQCSSQTPSHQQHSVARAFAASSMVFGRPHLFRPEIVKACTLLAWCLQSLTQQAAQARGACLLRRARFQTGLFFFTWLGIRQHCTSHIAVRLCPA
jgi:hypothetical protein